MQRGEATLNESGDQKERHHEHFENPMTTAAAIDRLVHHSVILELNLPSYRLEASKRQISTVQQAEPVD